VNEPENPGSEVIKALSEDGGPRKEARPVQGPYRQEPRNPSSHPRPLAEKSSSRNDARPVQDPHRQEPRNSSCHSRAPPENGPSRLEARPGQGTHRQEAYRQEPKNCDSQHMYTQGSPAQPGRTQGPASKREPHCKLGDEVMYCRAPQLQLPYGRTSSGHGDNGQPLYYGNFYGGISRSTQHTSLASFGRRASPTCVCVQLIRITAQSGKIGNWVNSLKSDTASI
jgi:hypothetical protein